MKTPTTDKDDQKYAPRPSWRGTWEPKRAVIIIDACARRVVFGPVGPDKVY